MWVNKYDAGWQPSVCLKTLSTFLPSSSGIHIIIRKADVLFCTGLFIIDNAFILHINICYCRVTVVDHLHTNRAISTSSLGFWPLLRGKASHLGTLTCPRKKKSVGIRPASVWCQLSGTGSTQFWGMLLSANMVSMQQDDLTREFMMGVINGVASVIVILF